MSPLGTFCQLHLCINLKHPAKPFGQWVSIFMHRGYEIVLACLLACLRGFSVKCLRRDMAMEDLLRAFLHMMF
jgi:hypothetical protein